LRRALPERPASEDLAVLVVVPTLAATERRFRRGNAAEAVGHAESVARATVGALREAGNAAGHIGPADPAVALADGLRTYDAERVIVSRQHPGARRYLEDVPVEQAARAFDVPMMELTREAHAEGGARAQKCAGVSGLVSRPPGPR
jgi:hypothetical protein